MLIVGEIPPIESLLAEADAADLASVEMFTAESRRRERLAWRVMLRRVLGREVRITYSVGGKPQICDDVYSHISVSHCRDMVAVVLSQRECGVDIELQTRDFGRVAARYMSGAELSMASSSELQAVVWSAKECLYKMAGVEGLDWREDIIVTDILCEQQQVRGSVVYRGEQLLDTLLHYHYPDEQHILLYGV